MKADNPMQQNSSLQLPPAHPRTLQKKRALALAVLIAVLVLANQESATILPRLCPWYNLTDIDCPFCGLTRSVIATADFQPATAFRLHPFGPAVLALLAGWLILCCLGLFRDCWSIKIPRRLKIYSGAALALGWLCWWLFSIIGG